MSRTDDHPLGAPAWVDTLQPDPVAAMRFYGPLFGWSFDAADSGLDSDYAIARLDRDRVAGITRTPPGSPVWWRVCVRVDDLGQSLDAAEAAGAARLVDPVDVPAAGRVATLADPTGVPFGLWEAGGLGGVERVDEPNTWQMASLHSPDPEQSAAFYGTVFGWSVAEVPDAPFAQWRLGDEVVAVLSSTVGLSVPPHWSVNFAVTDVDAFADEARRLGGTALMPPFDTPGFRNAVLADPQGGVFAISATTD
ncbi:MAG: VOC family protein [Propionibacteriaceae bacterium]